MLRQQCPVCAEVLSNKTICNIHLVKNHFLRRLTSQFPLAAVMNRVTFPCMVDGCTEVRQHQIYGKKKLVIFSRGPKPRAEAAGRSPSIPI